MKTLLKSLALAGVSIVLFTTCKKEYFQPDRFAGGSYSPTVAVPLADLTVTIEDVLKRWQSNVIQEYDPELSTGGDSIFFLKLVYSDTIKSIDVASFDDGAGNYTIPLDLPIERTLLRIFGNFENGTFVLTNPSLEFIVVNGIEESFTLQFRPDELYTENVNTGEKRQLEIDDTKVTYPFVIAQGSAANKVASPFELNNENMVFQGTGIGAMSYVFEPTPKYLNYGIRMTPTGDGASPAGSMDIVANVHLPLEGYGNIVYSDTINYSLFEPDQADLFNFAEIRLVVENGMPMETVISALVYDSNDFSKPIMELPFYENGNVKTPGIVVGAAEPGPAPNYRPTASVKEVTDIGIYNTHPETGDELNDLDKFVKGNKIVLTATIQTTNYSSGEIVKMFSDYSMNIKLGVRAQANLNLGDLDNDGNK